MNASKPGRESWRPRLRKARDRAVRRALGADLKATRSDAAVVRKDVARTNKDVKALGAAVKELSARLAEVSTAQRATQGVMESFIADLGRVHDDVQRSVGLGESARDDLPALRRRLGLARSDASFASAWDDPEPLVSVRIASYQDTRALVERALPSVFAQTYANIEVVVVNDGPNPATREAVKRLGDARVRYVEFPFRRTYPEDKRHRWMVAGSPGMNEGARLATGRWIAPLDEDDEFTPDHVERLLGLARAERAELVYGAFDRIHDATGRHLRIFAYPPKLGGFTFQAAMVHADLRFFEYDEESWRVDEPGDWNLCRRMMQAGVRIAAVDEIVGTMHHVALDDKSS